MRQHLRIRSAQSETAADSQKEEKAKTVTSVERELRLLERATPVRTPRNAPAIALIEPQADAAVSMSIARIGPGARQLEQQRIIPIGLDLHQEIPLATRAADAQQLRRFIVIGLVEIQRISHSGQHSELTSGLIDTA